MEEEEDGVVVIGNVPAVNDEEFFLLPEKGRGDDEDEGCVEGCIESITCPSRASKETTTTEWIQGDCENFSVVTALLVVPPMVVVVLEEVAVVIGMASEVFPIAAV